MVSATTREHGNIRIVVWIPVAMNEKFLKLCGVEAIVTGMYIMTDEDRNFFSVVPLIDATREEALKRAAYHGADTWGVVPMRNGSWAIRVRREQYESAAKQIRPEDYASITGLVYELKGFPEYMCEDGVREFLGNANPLVEVKGSTKYGWGEARRRKFLV